MTNYQVHVLSAKTQDTELYFNGILRENHTNEDVQ